MFVLNGRQEWRRDKTGEWGWNPRFPSALVLEKGRNSRRGQKH